MHRHLPPTEMLADFASGTSTPAVSLLVAAHLTQVPESRGQVRAFEDAFGLMLKDETSDPVSEDSFDAIMAQIDAESNGVANLDSAAEAHAAPVQDECPIPRPVMDVIGLKFDEIPWKFKLPGVSTYELDAFGDQKVSLLKARPGASVPQHTHHGMELTLVMKGALLDAGIEYRAGDVALNTEDDDHCPRILGDETCYCLIVQQGDLHFTGRFSRILNYIGE